MKKAGKIILYVLGVLILFSVLIHVFHDNILTYVLKKIISGKSKGKIELTLDSFHLNVADGFISIKKPVFLFSDVYMNEAKSIKLDKIVFEKIEIDKLDIWKLIVDRNIIADSFLIEKPNFWLTEQGTESKSSFHPEKLLKAINQNPDIFSRIIVRIDDIEIHYGSIMLAEYITPDAYPELVDFTILLEGFNSHPENNENQNRILFSDELRLMLRNLHKELQSGYILDIGSAIFSSNHRDLVISGVSLQPGNKDPGENHIGIKAGELILSDIGLEEIRGLEDLSLRSVALTDGEFVNYSNKKHTSQQDTASSHGLEQLAKVLYDFRLDTVSIRNFNYYNVKDYTDTVISANKIDFQMTDIKIDSGMFEDLFWNLTYDDINFTTGSVALKKLIPDLNVDYDHLSYSDAYRSFSLSGLNVITDTTAGKLKAIKLNVPELQINGVSLRDLQKRRKQHLSISILNPTGDFDITQLNGSKKTGIKKGGFPDYLILDKIVINNGNFHVSKENAFMVGIFGLDVEVDGLQLPEMENDQIQYNQISFGYDRADTYFEKDVISLTTGEMGYKSRQLWINNIKLKQKTGDKVGKLQIKGVSLTDIDLDRLVNKNELYLAQILLSSPILNGEFSIENDGKTEKKKPFHELISPLSLSIDKVAIESGKINAIINLNNDELDIQTDYNFSLGPIAINEGDSLKTVLDGIRWRLELDGLHAKAANHLIEVKQILSDAYRSEFRIEDLAISGLSGFDRDSKKMNIRSLSVPLLDITGLNYDLLINHDSIALGTILLDNPDIDIILPLKSSDSIPVPNKKIDLKDYLVFSYDTIMMNKLHLLIEKRGNLSHAVFGLNEFNFSHHYTNQNSGNLINNLDFEFKEFLFRDSITNQFLSIQGGFVDADKSTLTIKGIQGSNIARKNNDKNDENSGMYFKSDEIKFFDFFIEESLPSQLRVGKLEIENFDLDVTQLHSENKKKTDFKINLEIMKRFSNVMTRLSVDTAVLDEISINIHTLNDTTRHTIKIDSIGLIVEKIEVDTSMIGKARPNLVSNLTIDLRGRTRITSDSLYEIKTGRLHYDFPKHRITIDSFYVMPRYAPAEFFKRAKFQTTRMQLFGRKIEINDIDTDELFLNDHIHFGSIDIFNLNSEFYRDKHYPIKPGTFKGLPREQLMNLGQVLTVDSIHVIDSHLKYKGLGEKSVYPGEIYFDQFNVTAYNITNKLKKGEKKNLEANISMRIMGEARLDATVFFPLHADSTTFQLSAKTETVDLSTLNPITENLLGIGIIRGEGSVDAPFIWANDSIARGNLVFKYKKLKLVTYNRKKEKLNKGVLSPLINFLINDLVVKSNNPKFARKPRTGQVYFVRDTQKSVVNYLFKSLLSGLLSTLGFNNKEERLERKEERKKR